MKPKDKKQKMIQIPCSEKVYDKIKKEAETNKRTIPNHIKVLLNKINWEE